MSDLFELIELNNKEVAKGNPPPFSLIHKELGIAVHDILRDKTGETVVECSNQEYGEAFVKEFIKESEAFQKHALDVVLSKRVLVQIKPYLKQNQLLGKNDRVDELVNAIETDYQNIFNLPEIDLSSVSERVEKSYLSIIDMTARVLDLSPFKLANTYIQTNKISSKVNILVNLYDTHETTVDIWYFFTKNCKIKWLLQLLTSEKSDITHFN